MLLLTVISLTILQWGVCAGQETLCYACADVFQPAMCMQTTICAPDEACYVERGLDDIGATKFYSGCLSKQACPIDQGDHFPIEQCLRCCLGDLCNIKGCGSLSVKAEDQLVCFSCNGVNSPGDCKTMQVCDPGEACGTTANKNQGILSYDMGCFGTAQCRNSNTQCCHWDGCHAHILPTSGTTPHGVPVSLTPSANGTAIVPPPSTRTTPPVPTNKADRTTPSVPTNKADRTTPSVPTNKADRTTPSVPTNKADRTTPSVPTNKADPTTPSVPTNKADRTTPSVPTNKADRTTPSVPTNKADRTTPSVPTNKADRTTPSVPTNKADRTTPSVPTNKADRTTPSVPTNMADTSIFPSSSTNMADTSMFSAGSTHMADTSMFSAGSTNMADTSMFSSGSTNMADTSMFSAGSTNMADTSMFSSGSTNMADTSMFSSGSTNMADTSMFSSGSTNMADTSMFSSGSTNMADTSMFSSGSTNMADTSMFSSGSTNMADTSMFSSGSTNMADTSSIEDTTAYGSTLDYFTSTDMVSAGMTSNAESTLVNTQTTFSATTELESTFTTGESTMGLDTTDMESSLPSGPSGSSSTSFTGQTTHFSTTAQTPTVTLPDAPVILGVNETALSKLPGTDLLLTCNAAGGQPIKYRWILPTTAHAQERVNGTILIITNLQANDSGDYICEATNQGGTATKIFHLTIQAASGVRSTIRGNAWVSPVARQVLYIAQCDVEGEPAPEVTWYKFDVPASSVQPYRFATQNRVLVFPELEPSLDSGLYVCNASNGDAQDLSYMAVYQNVSVDCETVFDKFRALYVYRAVCPQPCVQTTSIALQSKVTDSSMICSTLVANAAGEVAWMLRPSGQVVQLTTNADGEIEISLL